MSEEVETEQIQTPAEESRASVADDIRAAMAELETTQADAAPGTAEAPSSNPQGPTAIKTSGKDATPEAAPLEKNSNPSEGKAQQVKAGPSVKDPNPESITAPISWSAEKRQAFTSLPRDVQQYIVERESETQRLISQKSGEYDKTVRSSKEVLDVLEPYRQNFAQRGISDKQAIEYLLRANEFLEKNPQDAIRRLAEMHGLDLAEVAQQTETIDPQIQTLKRELDELKGHYSQQQTRAQQQYLQQIDTFISSFEKATDAEGNKLYPHVGDPSFEGLMAGEVTRLRNMNPQIPLDTLLKTAYENTIWIHPELREAEIKKRHGIAEARRISEEKTKTAEARKRAVSVTGSPSGAAKPMTTGSVRGDIEAAFEALGR
jgi:hypothetical protein